jgi:hypothetical protein
MPQRVLGLLARPALVGRTRRHVLAPAIRAAPDREHRRLAPLVDEDAAWRSNNSVTAAAEPVKVTPGQNNDNQGQNHNH